MKIKYLLIKIFVLNLSQVIIEKFLKVCKKRIIFLREERIGHQLGNYECSIKEAISLKKKCIKTIFIFYEKPSQVANIYARELIIKNAKNNKFKIIQCGENFSLIRLFIKKIACNFNHSKSNYFVT